MKLQENIDLHEGNVLNSDSSRYLILEFIGEGAFGKVAHCTNIRTGKEVALKIIKTKKSRESEREIEMLKEVSILNPAKKNMVQFLEKFEHEGYTCLTFEMLQKSLHRFMNHRSWQPLSLNELRPIAQQLLTAFDALKGIGVIHADLKLDNIMLVNHDQQPLRVKLIDFGMALKTSEVKAGMIMSVVGYRAPEVFLGLPFTEAVDMWALGCILAQLYMSKWLFGMDSEYDVMEKIVGIIGQPADHLLSAGMFTKYYFKENRHWDDPKWSLNTWLEYQLKTGIQAKTTERSINSLDDLIILNPNINETIELEDHRAFVSLLKCLLETDPEKRIQPGRALKHPFISMVHLKEEMGSSPYMEDALKKMSVIPKETSEEEPGPATEIKELGIKDAPAAGSCDGIANMPDGAPAAGGSVSPCSCDGITNMPDGAPAAGGPVSPCSGDGTSHVPDGAPAEEARGLTIHLEAEEALKSNTDGADSSAIQHGAEEEPRTNADGSARVRTSCLKRIRRFFSRAIRNIFGRRETSA